MSAASSTPNTATAIDQRAIFLTLPGFFFSFFSFLGGTGAAFAVSVVGRGEGHSKKEAEQMAARAALERLE